MRKFKKWMIGFTLIVASQACNVQEPKTDPNSTKSDCSGKVATCDNIDIRDIPNNVPADIVVLSLFSNYNFQFRSNSFEKFTELRCLFIKNVTNPSRNIVVEESTLLPLKKLKVLNMRDAGFSHVNFKFPDSLKTLYLDRNIFDVLDLSNIKDLEELSLVRCGLSDLPKIHKLAPLVKLTADDKLINLTPEGLSHYCHLKSLQLLLHFPPAIRKEDFCRCFRIKKWVSLLSAEKKLEHQKDSFQCGPAHGNHTDDECSSDFTEAIENRRSCLFPQEETPPSGMSGTSRIAIILFSILLLALIILVIGYFVWMRMTSEPDETAETDEGDSEEETSAEEVITQEGED